MNQPENTPRPWEQLPNEGVEAYARFLRYRNLGAGRSIALAYAAYRHECGGDTDDAKSAKKSQKMPPVPGNWGEECAAFNWVDRANAWDIHILEEHGQALAVLWLSNLKRLAEKCAERLADPKFRPKNFADVVTVMDRLTVFLSSDVLKRVQSPAASPPAGDRASVQ